MSWIDVLKYRVRLWLGRERLSREMEDELRFHLDLDTMHREHDGAPAGQAGAASRRRLGNVGSVLDERRVASGLAGWDRVAQDTRYAARQLARAPGFAVAVILTLALGIGANSTMFAIIDRVMLRAPEGIADAHRVLQLLAWTEGRDGTRDSSGAMSYSSYVELREMRDVFEHVTAARAMMDIPIGRGLDAVNARGGLVSGDYFETLGVRAALGRFFSRDETHETSGIPVVVVSHAYWMQRFDGSRDVIGRTLLANNTPFTIVGVAPRGFTGHTLDAVDFWIPIAAAPGLRMGGTDWASERGTRWLNVIVRLRSDVAPARALARVGVGWTAWNIRPDRPGARAPNAYFVSLVPADRAARPEHRVARLLGGVTLVLLLITCANVANLLLARSLSRRREIAVRLALGVSRVRLTLLFLIDAVVLALMGGVAALAVAYWGIPIVRAVLFAGSATGDWSIDRRVVVFTILVALAAGAVAGLIPALQASRPSLIGALRQGTREGVVHRSRTRLALLVTQGALSVALLAGTGMFVRSLQRIGQQHLGLDLHRVLVADFDGNRSGFAAEQIMQANREMRERARRIPGVESVSLTVGVPLEGQYGLPLRIPGRDSIPGMPRGHAPFIYAVTPDFFRTMGTRIIAGRGLTEADDRAEAPAVAIVSAAMARLIWPRGDAIGQCFKIELRRPTPDCTQVVGIAEDARREALLEASAAYQYYVPLAQAPGMMTEQTLLVRAADPARVRALLGRTLQAARADMPYVRVRTLEEAVAPELRPWRLGASMFALFGALALVVAAIGTYSVMQFSVAQRRHELGIRLALGARGGHIIRLVTGESLRLAALAALAGVAMVLLLGRFVRDLLFETSPHDPVVLVAVVAVLLVAGGAATLLPAWKATKVDPARTLSAD